MKCIIEWNLETRMHRHVHVSWLLEGYLAVEGATALGQSQSKWSVDATCTPLASHGIHIKFRCWVVC